MGRQLAQARSVLRLSTPDLQGFSPETLAGTITSESPVTTLLSSLVQGLVTVSHELSRVTQTLATISEDNENLKEELLDISSQISNLASAQDHQPCQGIADIHASIRDLLHRVSAPTTILPQVQVPSHRAPPPSTAGPTHSRKGKERAVAPLSPPPATAEDPKYLIEFYYTRPGKDFGDPKRYAKLYVNSYKAGEFPKGRYNLDSFTPGHLHIDNVLSVSYAPAASGSGSGCKGKNRARKPPSL